MLTLQFKTALPSSPRAGISDRDRAAEVESSSLDADVELCKKLQTYLEYRAQRLEPPTEFTRIWDRFYDTYTSRIMAYLRKSELPDADLEDCVQSVWAEIVANLVRLRFDPRRGRLSTWVITLARNRSVDIARRRRRVSTGLNEKMIALVDPELGPAGACELQSTRARVVDLLAEFSEQVTELNFQVFHQRLIEGRTGVEVAASLGLTPEQVRFRLHRMKRKFRDVLDRSRLLSCTES